jgi:transposase
VYGDDRGVWSLGGGLAAIITEGTSMSTSCRVAPWASYIERQPPTESGRLRFGAVRRFTRLGRGAWDHLVRKGRAPARVSEDPEEWDAREIAAWIAWRKDLPTLDQREAVGDKISRMNCGASNEFVRMALTRGDFDPAAVSKEFVKVRRGRSFMVLLLTFIDVPAINRLRNSETGFRSEAARKWWEPRKQLREGRALMLLLSAACYFLGFSKRQFLRLAKKQAFPFTWRDHYGNETLPPTDGKPANTGDGAFKYYYASGLTEYLNKRNAMTLEQACEEEGTYTPEQTGKLLGLPLSRLKYSEDIKALGLVRRKVRALNDCKRKTGEDGKPKRGKRKWTRTRPYTTFTKASVHARMEKGTNVMGLTIGEGVTREEAAQELGVSVETVQSWWAHGVLAGENKQRWTQAGVRSPLVLTKASLAGAKEVLELTNGDVNKATIILRVMAARGAGKWPAARLCAVEVQLQFNVNPSRLWALRTMGILPVERIEASEDNDTGIRYPGGWSFLPDDVRKVLNYDGRTKAARANRPLLPAVAVGDDGGAKVPTQPMESSAGRIKPDGNMTPERFEAPDYGVIDRESGKKLDLIHREHGQKLDHIGKHVERMASHMESLLPTKLRRHLKPPNIVVVDDQEVSIQQRLWHLLCAILDANGKALSLSEAAEVMAPGKALADKPVMNAVSDLNTALLEFRLPNDWPEVYSVKSGYIITQPKRP